MSSEVKQSPPIYEWKEELWPPDGVSLVPASDFDRVAAELAEVTRQRDAPEYMFQVAADLRRSRKALAEAIEYISLDSELPPMIDRWRAALTDKGVS